MKIGIMGSYGEGNTGDETILLGIIQQIRSVDPNTKIYVFSHNPGYSASTFSDIVAIEVLPAGIRSSAKQMLLPHLRSNANVIKELDAVLIGGGGIFYDYLFSKGRNPIKVWHSRIKRITSEDIPVYLYSVGLARFRLEESRILMKEICDSVSGFCVRDDASKLLLEGHFDAKKPDIHVVPDPAWYAQIKSKKTKQEYIGVNLRYWEQFVKNNPDHLKLWGEYFNWLGTKGKIKFLTFSWRKDNDLNYLGQVTKYTDVPIETPVAETPEMAFHEIKTCKYVIGMRLHSQILSIKAGVPVGAIAYHSKVVNQLSNIDVPIIKLEDITLKNLKEFTERVEKSKPSNMPVFAEKNAFAHIVEDIRRKKRAKKAATKN